MIRIGPMTVNSQIFLSEKQRILIREKLPSWLRAKGFDERHKFAFMLNARVSNMGIKDGLVIYPPVGPDTTMAVVITVPMGDHTSLRDSLIKPLAYLETALAECLKELERHKVE